MSFNSLQILYTMCSSRKYPATEIPKRDREGQEEEEGGGGVLIRGNFRGGGGGCLQRFFPRGSE